MSTSIPKEKTKSTPAPATKKPGVAKRSAHAAPPKAKPARKVTGAQKPPAARRGSQTAKILDLLKRPGGVTLKEIMKATGWQAHSVRGFLSGTVKKKIGLAVESFKKGDGERAYRIGSK
jgi:hypothetical protein